MLAHTFLFVFFSSLTDGFLKKLIVLTTTK